MCLSRTAFGLAGHSPCRSLFTLHNLGLLGRKWLTADWHSSTDFKHACFCKGMGVVTWRGTGGWTFELGAARDLNRVFFGITIILIVLIWRPLRDFVSRSFCIVKMPVRYTSYFVFVLKMFYSFTMLITSFIISHFVMQVSLMHKMLPMLYSLPIYMCHLHLCSHLLCTLSCKQTQYNSIFTLPRSPWRGSFFAFLVPNNYVNHTYINRHRLIQLIWSSTNALSCVVLLTLNSPIIASKWCLTFLYNR